MSGSNGNGDTPWEEPFEHGELRLTEEDAILHAVGDIDLYQANHFRQEATAYIQRTEKPLLDLTLVPFLDSAGLAALLALSREAKALGRSLRLRITGGPRRVLRITGIDRMLELEEGS